VKVKGSGRYTTNKKFGGLFSFHVSPAPSDTGRIAAVNQMLVTEGGTYAFGLHLLYSINNSIHFSLRGYYNNVRIKDMSSFGTYRVRPSAEVVLWPKKFSLYAGWTMLSVGGGSDDFVETFGSIDRSFGYADIGVYGQIDFPLREFIFIDLQFLLVNGSLKSLKDTNDDVIPIFRVGYQYDLLRPN
jgi:hypothetical protein